MHKLSGVILATLLSSPAARAGEEGVVLNLIQNGKESHRVEGVFFSSASSSVIWSVLTDYNHIPEFVSSMKSSMFLERRDGTVWVEQEAHAKIFIFSKDMYVLLQVEENPQKKLFFTDVSGESFKIYEGSWRVEETPEGHWVRYELNAMPRTAAPAFLYKGAFVKMARSLLVQVRDEILRRQ